MHCDADQSRSFAIDVFEDQHLNTDQSGKGSYDHFIRNVRRWCGTADNVEIIKQSSLDVKPSDIRAAGGDVRLFSIDGGHTEKCMEHHATSKVMLAQIRPHGLRQ